MAARGDWLPSVYIGTLVSDGTHLLAQRRLTLDENENIPTAWTPDSKAVLFSSNRNGKREIFKQAIDQILPERLVSRRVSRQQLKVGAAVGVGSLESIRQKDPYERT